MRLCIFNENQYHFHNNTLVSHFRLFHEFKSLSRFRNKCGFWSKPGLRIYQQLKSKQYYWMSQFFVNNQISFFGMFFKFESHVKRCKNNCSSKFLELSGIFTKNVWKIRQTYLVLNCTTFINKLVHHDPLKQYSMYNV